ncbi:FtsX-like permease family protein [Nocardioides sp.]|uniref:FtsX-like permease family protein n=1 Tax=Nocardioides sp. TaxID=35761 RepID=UPI003783290F
MIRRPRLHGPTIAGRLRSDAPLLVLMGLVVAVTTLLTASVAPVGDHAADRAVAAAVEDAGLDGAVVASPPRDPYGSVDFSRDPSAADQVRRTAERAQAALPARLAAMLDPGIASVTTPQIHLLDHGPGRYLVLTYLDTPHGSPAVRYLEGRAPRPGAPADEGPVEVERGGPPWPVEVAVSRPVARALAIGPGDRLPGEDDQHQPIRIRVSGVYAATDPQAAAWQLSPELLDPARGDLQGVEQVTGGALVSSDSLPDLQLAVPSNELARHVTFPTRSAVVRWRNTEAITREVAHLQVSADATATGLTWDSALGAVLTNARDQVTAAQGQAQVVLVGLVASALLVLALAAQLLVSRRRGPIVVARERGASLVEVAGELLVEAVVVAAVGTTLGLVAADLLVGGVGWAWAVPVVAVAVLAAPVYGAVVAARSTSVRRVPANRSARRAIDRTRRARRLAVEVTVLAAAALSLTALRQRGVVDQSGWGGLTAAAAATLCAVAGTVVVVRLLTPAVRLGLRAARRSVDGVGLLVTARLSQTAGRVLPVLAVSVAVAQLTFGVALAATEHQGQEAGALLAVGGDARLRPAPEAGLRSAVREVARAPGVLAAADGLVDDGARLVSDRTAAPVRMVVVDAAAYQRLLASSPLPDAPQLARLGGSRADQVPALLLGGSADLREHPVLHWRDSSVQLDVVGAAPRVEASVAPVVVVDAGDLGRAGVVATPDTVWAVGPGAGQALRVIGDGAGSVTTSAGELDARRHDPLARAVVGLAAAASVPLLVFAILGVVLAAAADAPARGLSLGRLRSLGLADRDLRRVLSGELLSTAAVAALTGLALGLASVLATAGSLSLQRITGQAVTPQVVVPWWSLLAGCAVVLSAGVVALSEWRGLRRRVLAELLRS